MKQLAVLAAARGLSASVPSAPPRVGVPIQFGSDKQVFCDWWFIEAGHGLAFTPREQKESGYRPFLMPHGVRLRVIPPIIQPDPIILPVNPADGIFIGVYSTLMRDGGKYRLWYEGWEDLEKPNNICYAESEEGRQWRKPELGLNEFHGSKRNNIVYLGGHGATIFLDPSAPENERYKLLHIMDAPKGEQPASWVFGAVSPDGLRWKRLEQPVLKHVSDTQSVVVYDADRGKYVAYVRGWEPESLIGYGGRRVVKRTESDSFRSFPRPDIVLAPESSDGPDVDIYTNAYQRWRGAARSHLMLPAFYHRATDIVDVHLAVSRDGVRWSRPSPNPLIPVGPQGSADLRKASWHLGCNDKSAHAKRFAA